jgi:DNA-binding NarL/FixJ family response regulator
MPANYRVVLADDHAFIRNGLRSILEQSAEFKVISEASDGQELLNVLDQGILPDVLVLDLSMPIIPGIEALRQIRQKSFVFRVLVLTLHRDPDLLCRTFLSGANGYLLKDEMVSELLPALRTLLENRVYISPRMAKELSDGCRLKDAAERKLVSPSIAHCPKNLAHSA